MSLALKSAHYHRQPEAAGNGVFGDAQANAGVVSSDVIAMKLWARREIFGGKKAVAWYLDYRDSGSGLPASCRWCEDPRDENSALGALGAPLAHTCQRWERGKFIAVVGEDELKYGHDWAAGDAGRYAGCIARKTGRGVDVYVDSSGRGQYDTLLLRTSPWAARGFGGEPLACVAPKWTWSELAGACVCAPDYVPSPSGADCLPRTVGADPPGTTPPAATGLAAVPTWALLAGGLVAVVVLVKVL